MPSRFFLSQTIQVASLPSCCPRNIRNCSNKALLILSGVLVLARSLGWRWWQWRWCWCWCTCHFFLNARQVAHVALPFRAGYFEVFFFLAPTTTWTCCFEHGFSDPHIGKSTTWWFAEARNSSIVYSHLRPIYAYLDDFCQVDEPNLIKLDMYIHIYI